MTVDGVPCRPFSNYKNRRLLTLNSWEVDSDFDEKYLAPNEKVVGWQQAGSEISFWIDKEDGTEWQRK